MTYALSELLRGQLELTENFLISQKKLYTAFVTSLNSAALQQQQFLEQQQREQQQQQEVQREQQQQQQQQQQQMKKHERKKEKVKETSKAKTRKVIKLWLTYLWIESIFRL